MRLTRGNVCFLVILLLLSSVAFARGDESLDALIARADAAPAGEHPGLYMEIAERELQNADHLYSTDQADAARTAVDSVVSYSEKACDAVHSKGKIKGMEIALRKMAAKLRDIKRSVAFEDQPPIQTAADRLERLRTDLLSRMFGKDH